MQFLIVTTGTAALTLQNHRTLVAMLRAERKARALAETDVLTGLPNRAGLLSRLHPRAERPPEAHISTIPRLFVDRGRLKAINDAHAPRAGDAGRTSSEEGGGGTERVKQCKFRRAPESIKK